MKGWLTFAAALGAMVLAGSCATNSLVGKGGTCFQSIDCQEGLACVPTPGGDGSSICTDDLSSIATPVEAGNDATTADATTDGPAPDTSVPDTSIPDTNVQDNDAPSDTGTPDASVDSSDASD